jgi:sulfite reductase alpha subunit-like flavoprotein
MLNLGAKAFHPRGLGDDQHPLGYDGALDPWLTGLWETMTKLLPLPAGCTVLNAKSIQPPQLTVAVTRTTDAEYKEKAVTYTKDSANGKAGSCLPDLSFGDATLIYKPVVVPITENRRLTSDDNPQDVRHIEFDLGDTPICDRYEPGDVLCVHPKNDSKTIDTFIHSLGYDPTDVIEIGKCGFVCRSAF